MHLLGAFSKCPRQQVLLLSARSLWIDPSRFTVVYNVQFLTLMFRPGAGAVAASPATQQRRRQPAASLASRRPPQRVSALRLLSVPCSVHIHSRFCKKPYGVLRKMHGERKGRLRPGQWESSSVQPSRSVCADHEARGSYRVHGVCLPFQQGAGSSNFLVQAAVRGIKQAEIPWASDSRARGGSGGHSW